MTPGSSGRAALGVTYCARRGEGIHAWSCRSDGADRGWGVQGVDPGGYDVRIGTRCHRSTGFRGRDGNGAGHVEAGGVQAMMTALAPTCRELERQGTARSARRREERKSDMDSTSAINNPLPAVSCNFRPALLPFSIQNLKNFPITFLFFPHSSSLCEKGKQTALEVNFPICIWHKPVKKPTLP